MRVLIAEDDPDDRNFISFAFQENNLDGNFHFVVDGEEAINYLSSLETSGKPSPQIIILDLNMPKKNGKEVLQWLKAHPLYCRIPVVILTTSSNEDEVNLLYSMGAATYFIKPFSVPELSEIIKKLYLLWLDGTAILPSTKH
jgi:DNA-binding response OmpR family regulator